MTALYDIKGQVRQLDQGCESWNAWREDLRYTRIYMPNVDFSERDLSGYDFSHSYLYNCKFSKTQLEKANFEHADLGGTKFEQCDLTHADFSNAQLPNSLVIGTKLDYTTFHDANLENVEFRECDLCINTSFSQAFMSGVSISDCTLEKASFWGAHLRAIEILRSNLSGAYFINCLIDTAKFKTVNLDGASFQSTSIRESEFSETNLARSEFRNRIAIDFSTLEASWPLPVVVLKSAGYRDSHIKILQKELRDRQPYMSCFISYSHEDKAFARRLWESLQGRGIQTFLDEKVLKPGTPLDEGIVNGVREYDKVILCCSKNSLTSWWVDTELETLFERERSLMKKRKRKVSLLIPLALDEYLFSEKCVNPKAIQIKSRIVLDYKGWKKNFDEYEEKVECLVEALKK